LERPNLLARCTLSEHTVVPTRRLQAAHYECQETRYSSGAGMVCGTSSSDDGENHHVTNDTGDDDRGGVLHRVLVEVGRGVLVALIHTMRPL
jgi:hypothetical protein